MAVGHNTGAVRENPGMPRERGKRRERPPEKKKIGFFHDKTAGAVDMPMLVITLVLLVLGITMMFSASHIRGFRRHSAGRKENGIYFHCAVYFRFRPNGN